MGTILSSFKKIFLAVLLFGVLMSPLCAGGVFAGETKPYKVALVIGDQWDDPMSFLVSRKNRDFFSLVVMLKSWGIPFEITRLDQEFMDINRFLGPDGRPEVGCILWNVNKSDALQPQRYEVIREAVNDYGISVIAISDRVEVPVIQEVLGIKYNGSWRTSDDLNIVGEHFITKGLKNPLDHRDSPTAHKNRMQVKLSGARAIVEQGLFPQVTVREVPSGAKNVWIGGDAERMFSYQEYRTLLRRAITWSIGYSLYKTWENTAFMILDDPGTAQNVWLEHWHYGTISEEVMIKYMIEPLKKHNAIVMMNVVPGFVNEELRRVEPSWQRKFVDKFGTLQDYPSTRRGLIKGLEAGVFEVHYQGLTHMQADLWSPPGPWFGAEVNQEKAEVAWYHEFSDGRRGKETPAAEQLWRMKTGLRWLEHQFGVTSLSFCQPGSGISRSYVNNTYRLAALAGFGWYCQSDGYLGRDMAVWGWNFQGTPESPRSLPAEPDGHDKGIAEYPEKFADIFEDYPDMKWISFNEFVGYTHAALSGGGEKQLSIELDYDAHYCTYFKDKPSQWTLLVSDWLGDDLKNPEITVDGKEQIKNADLSGRLTITIGAGIGRHKIDIR